MKKRNNFNGSEWLTALVLLLVVCSCASMGRPSGGFRDWDPPVYLRSTPGLDQTNVKRQKIEIEFDEIILLDKPNEKVIVSPPQKEKEQVKATGRKVTITLKDTLRENTTYTIDFGDAIQDNNEKNPLESFSLSFATGPTIDSMQISGAVLNAYNLEPVTGAFAGVYRNLSDTAFTTTRFERISSSDGYGRFTIRNMAKGEYKVYVVADINRNYYFDMPTEDIAFLDTTFIPTLHTEGMIDTIRTPDGRIDSIIDMRIVDYQPTNLLLRLFNEERATLYLDKYTRPERSKLKFDFSTITDAKPILKPVNFEADSTWYVVQIVTDPKAQPAAAKAGSSSSDNNSSTDNGPKSSFTVWLTDSLVYKRDTLLIEATYLRSDSLNQRVAYTDTLKFNFKDPKPPKKKKSSRKSKEEAAPKDSVPQKEVIKFLELAKKPASPFEFYDRPTLEWKEPVEHFDSAGFHFEMKIDSVWHPMEAKLEFDTLGLVTFYLDPKKDWEDSTLYRVVVDSAAVTSCYGTRNKPEKCEFKTKTADEYCNLFLTITGVTGPAFAELLDQNDTPVTHSNVQKDGNCEFWYVKPGTYYLRLILDTNGDGKWTTGNYAEKRQPETVVYFNTSLELRANWDVEQSWDIWSVPPEKQKPLEITKNLPKELQEQINRNKQNSQGQGQNNSSGGGRPNSGFGGF